MANCSQCCTHKKAACGRCNSRICSACCKCPKLLGRPWKHGVLGSKESEHRNKYRASRPTCLDDMVPEEGISALPTDHIASKSNILIVYKLIVPARIVSYMGPAISYLGYSPVHVGDLS